MAPEQARGDRDVDARADVFALGCVLFECLTGQPTFQGAHPVAMLARILLEQAPRVRELRPDLPPALDDLVARMLAKEAERRPRDAAAVVAEVEALGPLEGEHPATERLTNASLGPREQRLLCVVLVEGSRATALEATDATRPSTGRLADLGAPPPSAPAEDPTITPPTGIPRASRAREPDAPGARGNDARLVALRAEAAEYGAELEVLADGSLVVTLLGAGSAVEQAARAARFVLSMRAMLPGPPMALAMGRGEVTQRWPVGEVIDRALAAVRGAGQLLGREGRGPLVVDEVAAGLLSARFEVTEGPVPELVGERAADFTARTLLGRPTSFVGRDRELRTLEAIVDECAGEPVARVALVTGSAGAGKSRLLHELLARLRDRGRPITVLRGRGDPTTASAPYGVLGAAIRRAAGILEGEPAAARREKLRSRLARHVTRADLPRVVRLVGRIAGVPAEDDAPEAGREVSVPKGDELRWAVEQWLRAECTAAPVLLALDDLEWADQATVKLLDGALLTLHDLPLMVLALARPEVHARFFGLWQGRKLHELPLDDLGPRASERLVREVLGANVANDTVRLVVERAAGNAFYLEELIRAVARGRGAELPPTVLAMVQARLEELDGEARRVLRAASVLGRVFWEGAVVAQLGGERNRTDVKTWLAELTEREVVTWRGEGKFPGEEEYAFRQGLVREAAYATLTASDRELGHRLAGEWLERVGETEAAALADHFERGARPERAVAWYRRAAEQSLEATDFATTIAHVEGGLRAGASGEISGALRLLEAEARRWRGEHEAAEAAAADALELLPRGGSLWFAAAAEAAMASGPLGHHDRLATLAEALAGDVDGGAAGAMVFASARDAVALLRRGRYELAASVLERLEKDEVPVPGRDPAVAARLREARALRSSFAGDPKASIALLEASADSFEQAGDAPNACAQRVSAGIGYLELGAVGRAQRALVGALRAAEEMGLHYLAATARQKLGVALGLRGALADAIATERAAVEAFREQGHAPLEGAARVGLASLLVRAGDVEAAEREALLAVERTRRIPPAHATALAALARARLAAGRPAEALSSAREAVASLEALRALDEGESGLRLVHAEALHAAGEVDEARERIAAAREILLARAARIADADLRASFLGRIPEHARTLELAEAWGAPPRAPS
jgi:tetratricopeptide (TPR) repeat protein